MLPFTAHESHTCWRPGEKKHCTFGLPWIETDQSTPLSTCGNASRVEGCWTRTRSIAFITPLSVALTVHPPITRSKRMPLLSWTSWVIASQNLWTLRMCARCCTRLGTEHSDLMGGLRHAYCNEIQLLVQHACRILGFSCHPTLVARAVSIVRVYVPF